MDVINRILFPTPAPSYSVNDFPNELIFIPQRGFGGQRGDAERLAAEVEVDDGDGDGDGDGDNANHGNDEDEDAEGPRIVRSVDSEQRRALNLHLGIWPEMKSDASSSTESNSNRDGSTNRSQHESRSKQRFNQNGKDNDILSGGISDIEVSHRVPSSSSSSRKLDRDARKDSVACLLLKSPSARFLFIYLHSNAEDLGRCYQFLQVLRAQFQVHVLAVEYPGYGVCPGHACEESVVANAVSAMEFAVNVLHWPQDEIIVIGRSIGSGPATALAAKYEVCGLVLVCPFFSVREVVKDYVGSAGEVFRERFPNYENIQKVRSQLLVVHGQADTVVPYTHGKRLFDLCPARKQLIVPVLMKHNSSLSSDASYFALPMLHFFGLPDYKFEEIVVPDWVYHRYRPDPPEESPHRGCTCINRIEVNSPLVCQVQGPASRTVSSPTSPQSGAASRGGAGGGGRGGGGGGGGGAGGAGGAVSPDDLEARKEQVLHVQKAVRELFDKERAKALLKDQIIGGLDDDSDDSEDLPEIPDDLGFFKAPPSRYVGLLGSPCKPSGEEAIERPRPHYPSSPTRGPHRTSRKAVQPRAAQETPDQLPIPESPSPPDWPNPPTPPNGRRPIAAAAATTPTNPSPPSVVNV